MKDINPYDAARISGGSTPLVIGNDPIGDPAAIPLAQPIDKELAPGTDPVPGPDNLTGIAAPRRLA